MFCLGKVNQNPTSNSAWEKKLDWFKDSSQHRTLDTIEEEPKEFKWNIFPGFTSLQLVQEVHKFMNKLGEPEQFQGRIILMSMFNDIIWELETMERSVLLMPHLCLYLQEDFQQDVGHSSDLDQKRSGIPPTMRVLEENGTESLN